MTDLDYAVTTQDSPARQTGSMCGRADGTPMTAARRDDGLMQMIQQNDEKHSDAHKRLRQDLDRLEEQVNKGFETLREGRQANSARIDHLERAPTDISKVVLAPRIVVAIVGLIVGIAGVFWASTYGLRSDVRDILTRIEAQRSASEAMGRLQDVQAAAMRESIEAMKRRQELQQYELQGMKELILTGKVRTR